MTTWQRYVMLGHMTRKNDEQIVVRLPEQLAADLHERAEAEERSRSQIVRMALAAYLKDAA